MPLTFLTLPSELRNKIYAYSVNNDFIYVHTKGRKQPAVTKVNRQIRSETLPVFYGLNTFKVALCRADVVTTRTVLSWWLNAIGKKNFSLIRCIEFSAPGFKFELHQKDQGKTLSIEHLKFRYKWDDILLKDEEDIRASLDEAAEYIARTKGSDGHIPGLSPHTLGQLLRYLVHVSTWRVLPTNVHERSTATDFVSGKVRFQKLDPFIVWGILE